jgi:putative YhbY family RNA-binding protein
MIELTPLQRRDLRAAAHHLHPVVSISQNGLTETVIKEIHRSLAAHELIKVKLYGIERQDREALLNEICAQLECAPVQHIGNTLVLWRPKPDEPAAKPSRPRARPMTKKQAAAALEKAPRRRAVKPRA